MQELLEAITDLIADSPPEKIEHLANEVRQLSGPADAGKLDGWALTQAARGRLRNVVSRWRAFDIPAPELAGLLVGASHAYHHAKREETLELVWTGPSSELVATRKTEQALLQVIDAASKKLFLTSFVAYDVGPIMAALTAALDRGVSVSMLLESSDEHGGGISIDAIGKMKQSFPAALIYYWGEKPDSFIGGKVHAKVAVADETHCFISSANLTGHAMEKNMEAGVLIRGGSVPEKLHRHLEALATTKTIKRA